MDKDKSKNSGPRDNSHEKREKIKIELASETIASEKHPEKNQDTVLINEEYATFGVLDGMGGHAAGEMASKIAREYILSHLNEIPDIADIEIVKESLSKIIIEASNAVNEAAHNNPEYHNMGSTAVIIKIHADENNKKYALVVNVGDSRAYKIGQNEILQQITTDDDVIGWYVSDKEEAQKIAEKNSNARTEEDLDQEGASRVFFRQRNQITKYIGSKKQISPTIEILPIEKGDKFIITTDGIHDNLTTDEIQEIVKQSSTLEEAAKNLKDKSLERSRQPAEMRAKPDDMSVIIFEVK